MYQSGCENDVAAPVSYGPYSQMALTWNSAPIAVITPATRNSRPVDFMANPGHTRTPMTLRSVRPGPGELGVLLAPHERQVDARAGRR